MQSRAVVAAAAGVAAAATAHAFDATGRLPFVHETADVRTAMAPALLVAWLVAAGLLAAAAACTRPLLFGAPAALAVSATPELVGRHDAGALAEPAAIHGALLQVLLLMVVVATALVVADRLTPAVATPLARAVTRPPLPMSVQPVRRRCVAVRRSRAPPLGLVVRSCS